MRILVQLAGPENPIWALLPVVVGAVIGAVAGAVPSYLLANKSAREIEEREEAAQLRLNKTAARSAAVKLQRIVNGLATINSQLDGMLSVVEQRGLPAHEIWKAFLPIGGIAPERVGFDTLELALVYDAAEAQLANDMILVAERHYAADLALFEYCARRRAFGDRVVIGNADGLSEEQILIQCEPIVAELSSAAPQIRDFYRTDQPTAIDVFKRYTQAMQKLFNSPQFLKLEIVERERG